MLLTRKTCSHCNTEKPLSEFYKHKARKDGYQTVCKCCQKSAREQYRRVNNPKTLEYAKQYRKANKSKVSEYDKQWRKANPGKRAALKAKYHAAKLRATPPWLTKSDYAKIETFYIQARELTKSTGVEYHVDHIIPLQGGDVCGLHVPGNLQVITAEENLRKYNKFEGASI